MLKVGSYQVKPLYDYMILKLVEEQSPTGLVIPKTVDRTKDDSAMFTVIDCGDSYCENGQWIQTFVKPGDTVMVSAYGLGKINIEKETFIVARARDVAMILKREEVKKDAGI